VVLEPDKCWCVYYILRIALLLNSLQYTNEEENNLQMEALRDKKSTTLWNALAHRTTISWS